MVNKMKDHIKTLEALVDAGDKATQGEWKVSECGCLMPVNGGYLADFVNNDAGVFITRSANARPAFKALLDELREQERVMGIMAEALEFTGDMTNNVKSRKSERKKALAQYETMKKDQG